MFVLLFLLVYDKTEEREYYEATHIVKEFEVVFNEHELSAIIGTKGEYDSISTNVGQVFAEKLGCRYYETTTEDFQRLDDIILELVELVFD